MSNAEKYFRDKSFPTGISDEEFKKWRHSHKGINWQQFSIEAMEEYARLKSQEDNKELVEALRGSQARVAELESALNLCRPIMHDLEKQNYTDEAVGVKYDEEIGAAYNALSSAIILTPATSAYQDLQSLITKHTPKG